MIDTCRRRKGRPRWLYVRQFLLDGVYWHHAWYRREGDEWWVYQFLSDYEDGATWFHRAVARETFKRRPI